MNRATEVLKGTYSWQEEITLSRKTIKRKINTLVPSVKDEVGQHDGVLWVRQFGYFQFTVIVC